MRPGWNNRDNLSSYRCLARDRGYCKCEQGYVRVDELDAQVVDELASIVIPDGFRQRVEISVRSRVENAEAMKRMEEIKAIVERIDFKWEKGFMTPEEYVSKRTRLQKEIEALRPIDYDDLIEAADLLENFGLYWDQCKKVENPAEAR